MERSSGVTRSPLYGPHRHSCRVSSASRRRRGPQPRTKVSTYHRSRPRPELRQRIMRDMHATALLVVMVTRIPDQEPRGRRSNRALANCRSCGRRAAIRGSAGRRVAAPRGREIARPSGSALRRLVRVRYARSCSDALRLTTTVHGAVDGRGFVHSRLLYAFGARNSSGFRPVRFQRSRTGTVERLPTIFSANSRSSCRRSDAVQGAESTHGACHVVAKSGMQAYGPAARCRIAQGLHPGSPSMASILRPLYQVLVKAEFYRLSIGPSVEPVCV